jgi:hypothetical protein
MRWRHALRGRLLRAHLALLSGDADGAADGAAGVVATAAGLGVERFAVLAGLVLAMAGGGGDIDALASRLPDVAGTEAWWWLARLYSTTGEDRWRQAAEQSVADLGRQAGDRRDQLAAFATRTITRGR